MRFTGDTMEYAASGTLPEIEIDDETVSEIPAIAIPVGVGLFALGVLFGYDELPFETTKEDAAEALGVEHLL
jgi:hypothetical protein